jgi:hypothetical protein
MGVDKHKPHVFEAIEILPLSPVGARGIATYVPPPVPGGTSKVCAVCRGQKGDRIHVDGETEADAESPNWG